MKRTSWFPPPSTLSAYLLLTLGTVALASVALPGGSLFRQVTATGLVTGEPLLDLPSLAFGGGLFFVGVAAVALGLALLFARAALPLRRR